MYTLERFRPGRRLQRPTEADIALTRLSRADGDGFARRRFLQGALAAGGATGLTLTSGAFDAIAAAAAPLPTTSKILVTVVLNGGNDHLNTLVPAESGAYHDARGSLAVQVDGSTAVGEGLHLHPNLTRLKTRFDAGQVALIRGVGEASDDHSHFTSMATWMSGIQNMIPPTGWLGRYAEAAGLGDLGSVAVGWDGVPLTLRGPSTSAVALPPGGGLFGSDRSEAWERDAFDVFSDLGGQPAGKGVFGPYVADAFANAVDTAVSVAPAFSPTLPEEGLARELALAAEVINLDLGTQLVNVNLGGFDTHEGQDPLHDDLMAELDAGLDAFFATLSPAFAHRTAVLVFSEFGRRVESNAGGTDHGTAGLMMLLGANVRGGLHGVQPSLTDLDWRGDMHHHLDFRSVYTSILNGWLDADGGSLLGNAYETLDLFDDQGGSLFLDVVPDSYYEPAVGWLAANGITTGTSPTTFSPSDPVTRGQMAAFLHRYKGEPSGAPEANFADVGRDRYYARPIDWLFQQGITTGTSSTTFSPDDFVTRGQMAAFLWRMEGQEAAPAAAFADVNRGRYYAPAIDWLFDRGITTGTSPTTFSPDAQVTRAQMATFLWRLAGSPV
ncbi:MAG: S-layer homology domain-containing protein [Actinomycetota bacterium]